MDFPGLIKKAQKCYHKSKGEKCTLTQKEANVLCEGSPMDLPNNIANFISFIMTCIFYSPLIPIAIPCALVGAFLNYWVSKYMLVCKHKMPDMLSELLATFFANLMPWIGFLWTIAFVYFIDRIRKD